MARYSAGGTTTAGSSVLPIAALTAAASVGAHIREIGVSNTSTTSLEVKLVRLTTAGTPGATLASAQHDPNSLASSCLLKNTYSSTGPTLVDLGYRATLGAAAGAGVVWVFGDSGLVLATGTANGIGIVPTGTGQACSVYFVWDE